MFCLMYGESILLRKKRYTFLSADLMADTHVERLILVIRPSSGGFSVEFFKFLFVDIGQMLACSINKGFVNDH